MRLQQQNYLDDDLFAERFARSRLTHHGHGRMKIRQGLRQRGVSKEQIEGGITAALREVSEDEILDTLARRYWKQHERIEAPRRFSRLWGFLLRRGFPPGLVRGRLHTLWPRWSDALEGLEPLDPTAIHGDDGGGDVE